MKDPQDLNTGAFWDATAFVVVYRYRYWDEERQEMRISEEYATLDAIKDGLGIVDTESGRKVARPELDRSGRYRPLAVAADAGQSEKTTAPE